MLVEGWRRMAMEGVMVKMLSACVLSFSLYILGYSGWFGSKTIEAMATAKEYGDQTDDQSGSTFALTEEDHTLGNSLRYILNKDPRVSFVGYTIPHPSEERVHLRLQTTGSSARSVLKDALQDLMAVSEHVRVTFEKAVEEQKALQGVREMSVGVSGKSGSEWQVWHHPSNRFYSCRSKLGPLS